MGRSERDETVKVKLTVAYDGTQYAGWQVQRTGVGVQQKIEEALAQLFPGAGRVHSSSRTDTGVHALGMAAHVEIPRGQFRLPPAKLALALNAHLPRDIRVLAARRCPKRFHARFDARGKQYRYFVWNQPMMNPLLRLYAWHVPQPLDYDRMSAAARLFVGRHDFKSFATSRDYPHETTVRTVGRCQIRRNGPLLTFIVEADGFLYRMCRGIVGTLVQVGQGKIRVDAIQRIISQRDRRLAGMTAPAHGLILWKVFYGRKPSP